MINYDKEGNRVYRCPVCHSGTIKVADNVFYGKCDLCSATLIDYQPLSHQEAFHADTAQYRELIGGFGTGKTTMACAETAAHCLSIDNAKFLITAPRLKQVQDAVIPELIRFLPPWLIEIQRNAPTPYFKLRNGSEILVYSSEDQQALRSLNLTGFYIEEASGVGYDIFDQLMTRLRNKAGIIRDKNGREIGYKYIGIVCTNPEDGWVKDRFLLRASKIVASPSVDVNQYKTMMQDKLEKHFHAFISSTRDNKYLPKEFIERTCAGKDAKWIRKYIDCILDVKEGAVYPDYGRYVVEPFPIPTKWLHIGGFDPGFNDPCAVPMAAIDPKDGCIYVYSDYYVREQPISYHARKVKEMIQGLNMYCPLQADPSVKKRSDRDGVSYADYFYQVSGVLLEPANNDILFGIEKVRDYMYAGKLKFFNTCFNIKEEASKYAYAKKETVNSNDTPVDKDNHLWDAIRYMIVKMPRNPHDMESIYVQKDVLNQAVTAVQLQDNDDNDPNVFGGFKIG